MLTSCHGREEPGSITPYRRVKHHVLRHIISGEWRVGDRIPSEHDLKALFGVSRMTVHRALRELTDEGYVSRTVGTGTFVSNRRPDSPSIAIRDIWQEAKAAGKSLRTRILSQHRARANAAAAARLRIPLGEPIFAARLVRWLENVPVQLEERWVNARLVPDFEAYDLNGQGVDERLMTQFAGMTLAYEVRAVVPIGTQKTLLALAPGEPCLRLASTLTKDTEVLSVADVLTPGNRYALPGRFL